MKRQIFLRVDFDWDNYDDVDPQLLLEDSGLLEGIKDRVSVEIIGNLPPGIVLNPTSESISGRPPHESGTIDVSMLSKTEIIDLLTPMLESYLFCDQDDNVTSFLNIVPYQRSRIGGDRLYTISSHGDIVWWNKSRFEKEYSYESLFFMYQYLKNKK